ncbi:glycosyltransferase family 2 protein, partial [Staphylococcus xylosus]|uniref:glycosyltransferase family 2 protein n=1 Tax=Staphylococcus xylosus TaxID=1288 RepID=UPI000FEE5B84
MKKLLSIIVPVYNKAYFLETCIESINKLNINKDVIEAIFVDDCSSDNSLEIVESFATKYDFIKLIQLDENTGSPSEPRNVGMKTATGEYITFLDADDWLDPEGLPILLNQAKDHHSDVAFGQSVKHTEKVTKKIGRFSSYKYDNHLVPYEIEKIFRAVGPPGKIIKRDIIIDNDIYFKHMKYGEDKLFFIEAISKCKTASMNPKATYHVNRYTYNQSLVGQTDIIKKTKLNLTVLDEVLKLELPSNAEFQAISRIVEVDYMSRLFKNNRFLKAKNKSVFYELFDEMVLMLESYGKNIEDYLLADTFKNIYQLLSNQAYQKLI